LVLLQEKAKTEKQTGTLILEKREISLALKGGYELESTCFILKFVLKLKQKKYRVLRS
jgi:TrmH family RNA methyltransferase